MNLPRCPQFNVYEAIMHWKKKEGSGKRNEFPIVYRTSVPSKFLQLKSTILSRVVKRFIEKNGQLL